MELVLAANDLSEVIGNFLGNIIAILAFIHLPAAVMCVTMADDKGYGGVGAFFLGLFFGLFAMLFYAGRPMTKRKFVEYEMAVDKERLERRKKEVSEQLERELLEERTRRRGKHDAE